MHTKKTPLLLSLALACLPIGTALAQSTDLPPPRSDNDPYPPVAAPAGAGQGIPEVTKQAGVGGDQGYGRAGVLELGGAAGFRAANDFTQFNLEPQVGIFWTDNLELSAIVSLNYAKVRGQDNTFFRALIEPSYHLPLNNTLFAFLGVGAGVAYAPKIMQGGVEGGGFGFAISPRLGLDILVGRSGILKPYFSVDYATTEIITAQAATLVGVSVSYGLNIGYTVMW